VPESLPYRRAPTIWLRFRFAITYRKAYPYARPVQSRDR
jgi:hypothetical protein